MEELNKEIIKIGAKILELKSTNQFRKDINNIAIEVKNFETQKEEISNEINKLNKLIEKGDQDELEQIQTIGQILNSLNEPCNASKIYTILKNNSFHFDLNLEKLKEKKKKLEKKYDEVVKNKNIKSNELYKLEMKEKIFLEEYDKLKKQKEELEKQKEELEKQKEDIIKGEINELLKDFKDIADEFHSKRKIIIDKMQKINKIQNKNKYDIPFNKDYKDLVVYSFDHLYFS
jgi:chromosome segregation ATPase